jgi:hypothetical protein
MKKVTLQFCDGRKMNFLDVADVIVSEEQFSCKMAEIPEEGKWFKVDPLAIDQNLFLEKREDSNQEKTRKLILKAFEEMKKDPKYKKAFKTMIPRMTWNTKNVAELKKLAQELGDHNANWVEQSFVWAQEIANGQSWEILCNNPDMNNWYRLVIWDSGYCRIIGGSRKDRLYIPSCAVTKADLNDVCVTNDVVPLVVSYDL